MRLNDDDLFQVTAGTNINTYAIETVMPDLHNSELSSASAIDRLNTETKMDMHLSMELHPEQPLSLGGERQIEGMSGSLEQVYPRGSQ